MLELRTLDSEGVKCVVLRCGRSYWFHPGLTLSCGMRVECLHSLIRVLYGGVKQEPFLFWLLLLA